MRHFSYIMLLLLIASCGQQGNSYKETATPAASDDSQPVAADEPVQPVIYKEADAYTACLFSQLSYCPQPAASAASYLPEWKIAWYPRAIGGNHAFVATDGNSYVVAVRGSLMEISWDAFDNWIYQDMNIVEQVRWPYTADKAARISGGSYRGWKNLEQLTDTATGEKLAAFLKRNITAQTPVVFTGHSLGGNLAAVYLSYFSDLLDKENRRCRLHLITFAAPAAGNAAFAKAFGARFPGACRIENKLDIVPKFPCTDKVAALGAIYQQPAAAEIMVGYKQATVSLSNVFKAVSAAMSLLELKNGLSSFAATEGEKDILLTSSVSEQNKNNTVTDWFAEAAFQHSIRQYATLLKVPVIDCLPE